MNKSNIILSLLLLVTLISFSSAEIKVYEFYQSTCPHCIKVTESGILDRMNELEDVSVEKYEINTPGGFKKYEEYHNKIRMQQGVPLAVIECETGEFQHLIGDSPIINDLPQTIENCRTGNIPTNPNTIFIIIFLLALTGSVYYLYIKMKKK